MNVSWMVSSPAMTYGVTKRANLFLSFLVMWPLSQIRHVADGSNPLTIEWKWSSMYLKIHTGLYLKFDC
jgi:hypothetical protein